jgi:uncharacterized protein YndB with AHSA1/START domain
MIKKVILGVLVFVVIVVAALSIAVAMQSEDFKVTRSATVNAPPDKVFEQVNDFHKWEAWSPWAKMDPNMKANYSGAPSGVGSVYSWTGNDEVGEGKMTISQSHPSEHIAIDLEFIKPFAAKNLTEFMFQPGGDKTNVTWTMTGKKNFMMKAFCMIMDMDKTVGGDFEKGLAQMKTVVESSLAQ